MPNLAALKKKPATGKGKKIYPVLPDPDGKIAKLVDNICDLKVQIDQAQGSFDIIGGDLKQAVRNHVFSGCDAPSTVELHGTRTKIKISVKNQYWPINDEDPRIDNLRKVMGERFDAIMEKGCTISIDANKIPGNQVQDFIDALVGIAEMYDAGDAIEAKEFYKPKKSFHLDRCSTFTEEENHEINRHLPMAVSLNAK